MPIKYAKGQYTNSDTGANYKTHEEAALAANAGNPTVLKQLENNNSSATPAPSQVINETTGQTAPTPSPITDVGLTPDQLANIRNLETRLAGGEFKVEPDDRGVDVNGLNETTTTDSVDDFRDEADFTATERFNSFFDEQKRLQEEIMTLSEPNEELESALGDLSKVREDRERLLDFSEDRQVDIGTIRGEQDQTQRAFSRRENTAINKANLLLNRQAQQISATEKALQFNQQNLDTVLQLHELTSPEIIGQEIDPVTGEVIAFSQDFNGNVTSQVIGTISVPDPEKNTIGIVTNKATNQQILVSEKDGVMITEPIDGTAGVAPLSEQDRLRNDLLRQQIENAKNEGLIDDAETESENAKGIQTAQSLFDAVNTVLSNPRALDALSGVSSLATFMPGTVGFDANADLDRVISLLTVDNLSLMTGVLTDKDLEVLKGAATSVRKGLSRENLVEELERLRDSSGGKISDAVPVSTQAASYGITTDEQDEVDFILMNSSLVGTGDYSSFYRN